MEIGAILHYTSITFIISSCSLGVGLGSGFSSLAALEAINIQPRARSEIIRASLIGLALIETAAILALIITFLLFLTPQIVVYTLPSAFASIGIACAMGITSFFVGYASSFPVKKACFSIARQPFFSQNILNIMLITQSIIQTAVIFGFLISLLIKLQIPSVTTVTESMRLLASGIAIGFGSIGPILGLANFAKKACDTISINRNAYSQILPFIFMSEAIIETPLIFAFLISLLLVVTPMANESWLSAIRMLSAAICIGIGTLAPSLSSSKTASAACGQIAQNPRQYAALSQTSMFGQGLIDAAAVYALLVSLLIIFIQ